MKSFSFDFHFDVHKCFYIKTNWIFIVCLYVLFLPFLCVHFVLGLLICCFGYFNNENAWQFWYRERMVSFYFPFSLIFLILYYLLLPECALTFIGILFASIPHEAFKLNWIKDVMGVWNSTNHHLLRKQKEAKKLKHKNSTIPLQHIFLDMFFFCKHFF